MADIVVNNKLNQSLVPQGEFVEDTQYSIKVIENTDYTYILKTAIGLSAHTSSPIWQIQRFGTSGSVTDIGWADGNKLFDNIYNNYSSYNYW